MTLKTLDSAAAELLPHQQIFRSNNFTIRFVFHPSGTLSGTVLESPIAIISGRDFEGLFVDDRNKIKVSFIIEEFRQELSPDHLVAFYGEITSSHDAESQLTANAFVVHDLFPEGVKTDILATGEKKTFIGM